VVMQNNKILDVLKAIAITLLVPLVFFLSMGPIKLAELWYPDYQWVRYLPLILFLIPAAVLIGGIEEEK